MKKNKLLELITSRKLWSLLISLLVMFQILPDTEAAKMLEAILTVIGAVAYIIGTAIESASRPPSAG